MDASLLSKGTESFGHDEVRWPAGRMQKYLLLGSFEGALLRISSSQIYSVIDLRNLPQLLFPLIPENTCVQLILCGGHHLFTITVTISGMIVRSTYLPVSLEIW